MPEKTPSVPDDRSLAEAESLLKRAEELNNVDEKTREQMLLDWESVTEARGNYDRSLDDIAKILESAQGNEAATKIAEEAIKKTWREIARKAFQEVTNQDSKFEKKWGPGSLTSEMLNEDLLNSQIKQREKFLRTKALKEEFRKKQSALMAEEAKRQKIRSEIEKRFVLEAE